MKKQTMIVLSVVVLAAVTLGSVRMTSDAEPAYIPVVVFQCQTTPNSDIVVQHASGSEGAPVIEPGHETQCAQAIADLVAQGMTMKHVSDDNTYTFFGR